MSEALRRIIQQESSTERAQRMIPAAAAGVLIATAYVFTFFLVNVYTFFNLPLALDWVRLISMWIPLALALVLFGAIAAWFTEEYMGIVGGGLIVTVLMAIVFLISLGASDGALTFQSIIMALPLMGIAALGAWIFRWAAHRYVDIQQDTNPKQRRNRMTKHVLTLIVFGLVPGILMRMDLPSSQALQHMHELLQSAPTDSSVLPQLPLKRVPALKEHFGVDYKFYVRQSSLSAGALDVTVRFEDGFTMTCLLPVGTGGSFITDCSEGETLNLEP